MNRWLRGLSIRTRITAGTLVVALILSVVAGLLLNAEISSIVNRTTVQLLASDSDPFEMAVRAHPTDPDQHIGDGQLIALIKPNGRVAVSNLPDSLEDRMSELMKLGDDPATVGHDASGYLVTVDKVKTQVGSWKIIAARSLEPGELLTDQLALTLVVGAAVLFLAFGVTSWVLSGAALRPVTRMRQKAEKLGDVTATTGTLPVGPARDELAALASTLNAFIERNRESVERERQMVSDASHELRTPLAVLIAQLEEASSAGSRPELVTGALHSARRLSRLTTNLLELSKLDAATATQSASWHDLALELAASTDRARTIALGTGVLVDFDVEDAGHSRSYDLSSSDFGRLADNLFLNSVAASSAGGSVLAVLSSDATHLSLIVKDNGPGVPQDFIPVAFDRFSRPDSARGQDDGGSGLGLAIVGAIVAAAHGSVEMRNLDHGLEVRVLIPHRAPDTRKIA